MVSNWQTKNLFKAEKVGAGLTTSSRVNHATFKLEGNTNSGKKLKIFLVCALLLGLVFLLSACDYPGQDPPCVGANKNAPGCADPVQKIVDDENGGPWYVSWALDIIRSILSSAAINAVRLGISVFWQVFTNLASTDFASCTTGNGGAGPTCTAASVFSMVNTVAFIFLPLILFYKIFKSYFLGGLIEPLHEGFLSFFTRILVGGFAMFFLAVLVSGAFGISNILFDTIIGGAASLSDISKNLLGDCGNASACGSGIGSVGNVKNIGLLLFMFVVCLAVAIIFIVLGLVFFLRTILIFILFAISPLAVIAGLTEEFRPWFIRWLQSIQAMLIAPIPVAICFALVKAFTGTIPAANGDPAGFTLQLVYIGSFMFIGAILMFKIAGEVGGFMFGVTAAGLGAITALGASSVSRALSNSGRDKSGEGEDSSEAAREHSNSGQNANSAGAGSSSMSNNPSLVRANTGSVISGYLPGGGEAGGSGTSVVNNTDQQQRNLLNALRSLNESLSASSMSRSVVTTNSSVSGGTGRKQGTSNGFADRLGYNVQSALLWSGNQAGVQAPYFRIGSGEGFGSRGNGSGNHTTSTTVTNERNDSFYSTSQKEYGPDLTPGSSLEVVNPGIDPDGRGDGSFTDPINSTNGGNISKAATTYPAPQPQRSTTGSTNNQIVPVEVTIISGNSPEKNQNTLNQNLSALPFPQAQVEPKSQRPRITGAIPDPYGKTNSRPILALPDPGLSGEDTNSAECAGKNGPDPFSVTASKE